jgi:hypothetical protein
MHFYGLKYGQQRKGKMKEIPLHAVQAYWE